MNILIIGAGGREHALGWKIKQSSHVDKLYFAPGNGGTSELGTNIDVAVDDVSGLLQFAQEKQIHITLVGPEVPLSLGIVDEFTKYGLAIFGPSKAAARLETSKAWATEFMKRHNIPHPESYIFKTSKEAHTKIDTLPWEGFVIKADGLAAGKGVIICSSKQEAHDAIDTMMEDKAFDSAGDVVVIQEMLEGYEVSIIACADGSIAAALLPAQDHKRAYNGDKGPNTGGMGAYCPVPFVSAELTKQIDETILQPTIQGMKEDGHIYKGMVYPGLMITKDGPKVLEYNVRFGDPETQPQMMLLESDLVEIIEACIDGDLSPELVTFKKGSAICVTLAAGGYPGSYKKGEEIHGLSSVSNENVQVFHAGTAEQDGKIVTAGGRVLSITATGETLEEAHAAAYQTIGKNGVWFNNMEHRTDIAHQAIKNNHDSSH